jgi:hypothetical protein
MLAIPIICPASGRSWRGSHRAFGPGFGQMGLVCRRWNGGIDRTSETGIIIESAGCRVKPWSISRRSPEIWKCRQLRLSILEELEGWRNGVREKRAGFRGLCEAQVWLRNCRSAWRHRLDPSPADAEALLEDRHRDWCLRKARIHAGAVAGSDLAVPLRRPVTGHLGRGRFANAERPLPSCPTAIKNHRLVSLA